MPSLTDIPLHVRNSTEPEILLAWLRNQPAPLWVQKSLASSWSRNNNIKLRASFWESLKQNATRLII